VTVRFVIGSHGMFLAEACSSGFSFCIHKAQETYGKVGSNSDPAIFLLAGACLLQWLLVFPDFVIFVDLIFW
jgi:hypothetical protein